MAEREDIVLGKVTVTDDMNIAGTVASSITSL